MPLRSSPTLARVRAFRASQTQSLACPLPSRLDRNARERPLGDQTRPPVRTFPTGDVSGTSLIYLGHPNVAGLVHLGHTGTRVKLFLAFACRLELHVFLDHVRDELPVWRKGQPRNFPQGARRQGIFDRKRLSLQNGCCAYGSSSAKSKESREGEYSSISVRAVQAILDSETSSSPRPQAGRVFQLRFLWRRSH